MKLVEYCGIRLLKLLLAVATWPLVNGLSAIYHIALNGTEMVYITLLRGTLVFSCSSEFAGCCEHCTCAVKL